ncbi:MULTISPECIES: MarR family winged helix-turn-helix transcriptional regulator [Gordonia]|uniref:MarR family transcriptional regulator n=1 Tax=Gordonia alkanivorans CGMCC 6845 TaxID=1423140 RepID=W9DLG1_9ACTN|nr:MULTISPECIES: MarR family transcriptional regulator [Gordonia]ETA08271.1 MarR family transcriptional regulator [Gordonia alkanivorans CGMCC 6845]MDH3006131.1 MarR family transcriptional regulator [Gordonia alkanivorans]MDH3012765.1 MarR family transcriptional regulator [Gordonia alkanivorans]MDH3015886.1 MarR family transcriptional regulator [Gordonia alkanivorans]MDH3021763.1 MarR family transcriptional regulator [Gordonia alkanivorans]
MSASDPAQLALTLRPTITRLYLALRRRAPRVELTAAQTSALNVLADDGWMRMGELADRESIRMPTATSVIDGLTRHELVERRPDPEDRRAVLVGLTDHGRALVSQIREERDVVLTSALAALNDEDRAALAAAGPALQALRDRLDETPTQPTNAT